MLTSESIFSRKDLMQYMKSTFAEDVEREKLRLQEYADIKPPEGMMAAIEMGFSGASSAPQVPVPSSPPVPTLPPVEPPPPPGPTGVRRSPTIGAMPKLTAPAPAPPPPEEDESGATMVVSGPEYFDEPATNPGLVGPGRKVTPVEVPRPSILDPLPPPRSPTSQRIPPVVTAAPPRPPVLAPSAAESTTVARQGRNTLDGMRAIRPESPAEPMMPSRPSASHSAVTAPARPAMAPPPPVMHEELEEEDSPTPASPVRPVRSPPPEKAAAPNRLPLIAALATLVLVVLGVVGFFLMKRPEPSGFILVHLPSEVRGSVRVSVGGQDLDIPKSGPLLQPVKAGPTLVMVSAEGYKTFTQSTEIAPGTTPTSLDVKLEREVQVTRVVIVTQPPDAELKVDGKVVREKGNSSTYIGELTVGTEVVVSASAPGFKPAQQRINPTLSDKPMDVQLKLEPDNFEVEVQSVPSGATIFAGGKELGVTPATVRLPLSVKQVNLKLRCHDEVDVEVAPAGGGSIATVKERLKKQRGCR
jgi:hypothetical protein